MLRFFVNDRLVQENNVPPTTTLLNYLRQNLVLTGTKEGCAEGDCGACTIAVLEVDEQNKKSYRAINSCLLLLPSLQGKRIYTVEGLQKAGMFHQVQESLVKHLGSQCGYCTPCVVMSMFAACYRDDLQEDWQLDDQMCGNLCRCTGYRPIREATKAIAGTQPEDGFSKRLTESTEALESVSYHNNDRHFYAPTRLHELWDAMENHENHRIVCGTTDLGLDITKKYIDFPCLISVERLPELHVFEHRGDSLRIGAAIPLAQIEKRAESIPMLTKMLRYFGARQISLALLDTLARLSLQSPAQLLSPSESLSSGVKTLSVSSQSVPFVMPKGGFSNP